MPESLAFNFDAEPDVASAPPREAFPPIAGCRPESRHASYTGARAVVETWTARQSAYLQLLRQAGSLNDFEAAKLLKWNVSSINSVRNALGDLITSDGFDPCTFTDASGHERTTKRTRWRLAA